MSPSKSAAVTAILLLGGAGLACSAIAAEPLRPGPPPLERFVGPLALTPAQQAKLRPAFAEAQKQAEDDVRDASSDGRKPNPAQLDATLRMHDADFRMKLSNVLSPAQMTQYEQMTADTTPREKAAEMHGAHGHHETDTPASAAERDVR
jgi:hypothetical protein